MNKCIKVYGQVGRELLAVRNKEHSKESLTTSGCILLSGLTI